jgi:hypothetical protein
MLARVHELALALQLCLTGIINYFPRSPFPLSESALTF